ncbi:MAG: motility protein A [Phycisphaerales bacterium]
MDKASVIGSAMMFGALGLVFWMATHGDLKSLWSEKGFIMVFLGTIAALLMAMPMNRITAVGGYVKRFMFHKATPMMELVKLIYELGEQARRDGILSLESRIAGIKDPFLAAGLKMAVDGADPDAIEATLRMEIMAMQDRHKSGKKFFDIIKTYGPGLGLVATLIGQIGMFKSLGGDIATMGYMLAVAVVATMYGTVMANCIAGPIGDKLALRSAEEILCREMMLQGVLSIQAGDNPRATLDRMAFFLPAPQRAKIKVAA